MPYCSHDEAEEMCSSRGEDPKVETKYCQVLDSEVNVGEEGAKCDYLKDGECSILDEDCII